MALVQHASANTNTETGQTSLTATLGSNTTSGNTLIVCLSAASESESAQTVSSLKLNTTSLTSAISSSISTIESMSAIYYLLNMTVNSTTVTLDVGNPGPICMDVFEWSSISALDKTAGGTGGNNVGTSTFSSGSLATLSQPNEVLFGVTGQLNTSSLTITGPSSPWTNESQLSTNDSSEGALWDQMSGYQVVTATTGLAYSGTQTAGSYGASCIASFKLAAAGGGLLMMFP